MTPRLKILFLTIATCCYTTTHAQTLPDSTIKKYDNATTAAAKDAILLSHFKTLANDSNDLAEALDVLEFFRKREDEQAMDLTQLYIADRFSRTGDYTTGIEKAFSIYPKFIERKDTTGIVYALRVIYKSYDVARNFPECLVYQKKSIPYLLSSNREQGLASLYNDIGASYAKANMPDSGIIYAQKAVQMDTRAKNEGNLIYSLSTLAENYIASEDFDLALPFLRRTKALNPAKYSAWAAAFIDNDFANAFRGLKQYDSAAMYARSAMLAADRMGFKELSVNAYECLYKSFDAMGAQDSVNKYLRLTVAARDSLFSISKVQSIQSISFRQELREQELEIEKAKEAEERERNLQFAAIAIGIIVFLSIFLLLSHTIVVEQRLISFLGILGLLILFEFINLFLEPHLARMTHHSPFLMLGAMVIIAALLIPIHHKLEKWITVKMVEKNKEIRLRAAKRTIEKLEKEKA